MINQSGFLEATICHYCGFFHACSNDFGAAEGFLPGVGSLMAFQIALPPGVNSFMF